MLSPPLLNEMQFGLGGWGLVRNHPTMLVENRVTRFDSLKNASRNPLLEPLSNKCRHFHQLQFRLLSCFAIEAQMT